MHLPSPHAALLVVGLALMPATNGFSQVVPQPLLVLQSPPSVPFRLPANPPTLMPKDNPAAKSLIADSLKQDEPPTETQPSGDPILDDVLGIIRRQGSVLDGSVLDPKADEALPDTFLPLKDAGKSESFDRDSVYRAAEQLLRVSRMLQRLRGRDRGRDRDSDELIRSMRLQAAKMLIDATSDASRESRERTPQASVSP